MPGYRALHSSRGYPRAIVKTDTKAGAWPRLARIGCGLTLLSCIVLTLIGAIMEKCSDQVREDAVPMVQEALRKRVDGLERRIEALEKRLEVVEPERR